MIAFIDGCWIEVVVCNISESLYPFLALCAICAKTGSICSFTPNLYVVDADTSSLGNESPVAVRKNSVIRMPSSLAIRPLDVNAYILPPQYKVLALWPETTAYYKAVVLSREYAKVCGMVLRKRIDCNSVGE